MKSIPTYLQYFPILTRFLNDVFEVLNVHWGLGIRTKRTVIRYQNKFYPNYLDNCKMAVSQLQS